MRYPARQAMEMVAMAPRTIPAMMPPDRVLLGEPGDGDVLCRAPSEGAVEREAPVGSTLEVVVVPEVLAVLVLLVARSVGDTKDIEVLSLEDVVDDVEDASMEEREMELIRHRTERSVWLPLEQVVN